MLAQSRKRASRPSKITTINSTRGTARTMTVKKPKRQFQLPKGYKPTAKADERRIYVILPETVTVPGEDYPWVMEPGRQLTQGQHIVSKMRMENISDLGMGPITTINLSVRNTAELCRVIADLGQVTKVTLFEDDNENFYGTKKKKILTAACTLPITKEQANYATGHLPRWDAPRAR
jgi:hypothetical protein